MIAAKTPCARNLQDSTNSHWFCFLPNLSAVLVIAGKVQKNRRGFSGRFKEVRREIEISPGSFSFGEAKENAEGQSQIFNMRSLIVEFLLELCYNAVLYGKYIRLDEQSLVCLHSRDKILPVFKGIQPVFARAIDL